MGAGVITIYKITDTTNGKVYVGQTRRMRIRKNAHKYEACVAKSSYPLYQAMRASGFENFKFEALETCDSQAEADYQEIYLIKVLCSADPFFGYNIALGGSRNSGGLPESTRIKMSAAQKGHSVSESTKRRLSELNKGHKISDETKRKLSAAHKGKPLSEEHRLKLKTARVGYTHSEETRAKMRASHKNRIFTDERKKRLSEAMTGRKFRQETLDRMKQASKKKMSVPPEQWPELARLRQEGLSLKKIGELYGCSDASVLRVLARIKEAGNG